MTSHLRRPIDDSLTSQFILLKARDRRMAAGALGSAALMSLIRALIMPWLLTASPKFSFSGIDVQMIQNLSLCLGGLFLLMSAWALRNPLPAAIVSIAVYVVITYPDVMNGGTLLQRGIISKLFMLGVLTRALASGLIHNTRSETDGIESRFA
jgi:hypothetical protein